MAIETVEVDFDKTKIVEDKSLEDELLAFQNDKSKFTPESSEPLPNEKVSETNSDGKKKTKKELKQEAEALEKAKVIKTPEQLLQEKLQQAFKNKIIVGFALMLLSGLNKFILDKVKGVTVPFEDMKFSDPEINSILPYINSPQIMEWINKIPDSILMLIHIEYMMLSKHTASVKKQTVGKTESEAREKLEETLTQK